MNPRTDSIPWDARKSRPRRASEERGKTIFLNSHLLSEIEMVCDQIVILNHGEVARTGTPDEFTRAKDK